MSTLTYPPAIILGALQGVTELFPISSLGHSVLVPSLFGWKGADFDVTAKNSPYLAFIVGMHVCTATAMIIYFWRDWLRIIRGFFGSFSQITSPAPGTGRFQFRDTNQRLAWMIILGTIPVGLAGVVLDHPLRTVLAKPTPTAVFLALNGVLLLGGELMRRRRAGLDAQQAIADERAVNAADGWGQGGAAHSQGGPRQGDYRDPSGYDRPAGRGAHRDQGQRGGYDQGGGYDQRGGYGDRGGQGYGDQGYDQRGGQGQGWDQGGGQRGGAAWGNDPHRGQGNSGQGYGGQGYGQRDDPWGGGYDRRGDHGGLGGGQNSGDAGGIGNGGPRGGDQWGRDQWGNESHGGRHGGGDQWGSAPQGRAPQGGAPQGGDPRGYDQRDYRQPSFDARPTQRVPQQPPAHASAAPAPHRSGKEHEADLAVQADQRLVKMSWLKAVLLGACQIIALFPGFSRDGSVMVGGMLGGLSRQDAVRYSFLLSAPVIFAAGLYKGSELFGKETTGIHGPVIAGSIVAGIGAYFALMFLDRFLSNPKRTLTPFAIYCVIAGLFFLVFAG